MRAHNLHFYRQISKAIDLLHLHYLRIKSLFFNLLDVMKTVGGAEIPCRILATTTVFITS